MSTNDACLAHAFEKILFYFSDLSAFSPRELLLLAYFLTSGPTFCKGIPSARAAGFAGSNQVLSVQASRTIAKAKKRGLMAALAAAAGVDLGAVLDRLRTHLYARKKFVQTKKNDDVVIHDVGDDYGTQRATIELLLKWGFVTPAIGADVAVPETSARTDRDDESFQAIGSDQDAPCASVTPAALSGPNVKRIVSSFGAAEYNQAHELGNLLEELIGLKVKVAAAEPVGPDGDKRNDD